MTKNTHGGRREGAGRKITGLRKDAQMGIQIAPVLREKVVREAYMQGKTISQFFEDMLLEKFGTAE